MTRQSRSASRPWSWRLGPPPRRGLRRGPARHRRAQGHRADLEARDLERRAELGPRGPARRPSWPTGVVGRCRMSNAAFVLIAIGLSVVVSLLIWLLNRKPQTFMSSIDDFEREMKALGRDGSTGGSGRHRRRTASPPPTERAPRRRRAERRRRRARSPGHSPRPRHRSRHGQHPGLRPRRGHRPQRAVRHRAQQPHAGRAGHGPRGLADDRPHAGLHRRRATAAQGRHHRLRDHAAHDPAAAAAGRRQPVQPAAGGHLRAVGHHRGRAAGGEGGGPAGRCGRGAPHRAADGGRHRRRAADQRAARQHGRRHRRRHHRDGGHLARRRRRPRGGADRLVRHRRPHPDLRPPRVRHRHRRAHGRGDQGHDRLGLADRERVHGRGARAAS